MQNDSERETIAMRAAADGRSCPASTSGMDLSWMVRRVTSPSDLRTRAACTSLASTHVFAVMVCEASPQAAKGTSCSMTSAISRAIMRARCGSGSTMRNSCTPDSRVIFSKHDCRASSEKPRARPSSTQARAKRCHASVVFGHAQLAHENSAAESSADPAALGQVLIGSADGIGVQVQPASEVTYAGQALTRRELLAKNARDDLCA